MVAYVSHGEPGWTCGQLHDSFLRADSVDREGGGLRDSHGSVEKHHHAPNQKEPATRAEGYPDLCRKKSYPSAVTHHFTRQTRPGSRKCDAWRGSTAAWEGRVSQSILWASDSHIEGILAEKIVLVGWGSSSTGGRWRRIIAVVEVPLGASINQKGRQWKGVGFACETGVLLHYLHSSIDEEAQGGTLAGALRELVELANPAGDHCLRAWFLFLETAQGAGDRRVSALLSPRPTPP